MNRYRKIKFLRAIVTMRNWYKEYTSLLILIGICVMSFAILLAITNLVFGKPNEFGDSAGAVNGLFSALAFAGVIFAIFLQKKELALQREELRKTCEEIAGQREEAERQNVTLRIQLFENTFFSMLSLQQEIVAGLNFSYEEKVTTIKDTEHGWFAEEKPEIRKVSGRDMFRFTFEEVEHYGKNKEIYHGIRDVLKNIGISGYESFYSPTYFDHYFRHLYIIIKFVDESDLIKGFEKRYQYTSIVRSQLSRYELVWLFYNSLFSYGIGKFKPLIERYALLKNLRLDLLLSAEEEKQYKLSAYEKNYPADAER